MRLLIRMIDEEACDDMSLQGSVEPVPLTATLEEYARVHARIQARVALHDRYAPPAWFQSCTRFIKLPITGWHPIQHCDVAVHARIVDLANSHRLEPLLNACGFRDYYFVGESQVMQHLPTQTQDSISSSAVGSAAPASPQPASSSFDAELSSNISMNLLFGAATASSAVATAAAVADSNGSFSIADGVPPVNDMNVDADDFDVRFRAFVEQSRLFREQRETLARLHGEDKWVVFRDGRLLGVFDNDASAQASVTYDDTAYISSLRPPMPVIAGQVLPIAQLEPIRPDLRPRMTIYVTARNSGSLQAILDTGAAAPVSICFSYSDARSYGISLRGHIEQIGSLSSGQMIFTRIQRFSDGVCSHSDADVQIWESQDMPTIAGMSLLSRYYLLVTPTVPGCFGNEKQLVVAFIDSSPAASVAVSASFSSASSLGVPSNTDSDEQR